MASFVLPILKGKGFMSSKVHRFGLVPLTIIPTNRFDKVLRMLKVLRFLECASNG